MTTRQAALVVYFAMLLAPASMFAEERFEQRDCCGAQIANSSSESGLTDAQLSPRLSPAEIMELRFPDVHITSAVHDDADPDADNGTALPLTKPIVVAHVAVRGVIGGTIQFELLLPDEWNGRFVMGGGGGFVGRVSNFARDSINRGYATVGTDTGHQWPSGTKAGWALDNVEAQVNFGHLAVHRTAVVAQAVIAAVYESDAEYSYFFGCSTGGGQALIEAQRYPDDFDGIISAAPVVSHTGLAAARVYNAQHFFPDPDKLDEPLITEELLLQLRAEVLSVCDEQDGVKDGILDDPRQCRFDLSQVEGLSPTQRDALQALYDGPSNENGQIYPGMPLGSEGRWYLWKAGSLPQVLARDHAPNPGFALGVDFCRFFMFNDPDWDYSAYDFSNWDRDAHLASTILDANNPDLSGFRESGGKLILWHGWSDGPLTPLASIEYYDAVEQRDPDLRDFFRFYLLPGVQHCRGGAGPDQVDWLQVLREWVEQGDTPDRLVARKLDNNGEVTMTRPLHPYPLRAVYTGSGSTNDAENFVLTESEDSQ